MPNDVAEGFPWIRDYVQRITAHVAFVGWQMRGTGRNERRRTTICKETQKKHTDVNYELGQMAFGAR